MSDTVEIRFSGSGGQGLILAANMLSRALVRNGRNVAQSQSYEPTSRGGLSRSDLVVTTGPADYPLTTALDYLVILDQVAVAISAGMIREKAIVITDSKTVTDPPTGDFTLLPLPIIDTAIKIGNRRIANIIAVTAISALGGLCSREELGDVIKERSPGAFLELNREAAETGWDMVSAEL